MLKLDFYEGIKNSLIPVGNFTAEGDVLDVKVNSSIDKTFKPWNKF